MSVLSARAVDGVLELFDLLMTTELLSKAERQSKEEKLRRRYPQVSRNAGKLAEAARVLLEMVEIDQGIELGVVWDLIEAKVTGTVLRSAVAVIDELVPPGDAELDGQRAEELAGRFATVRPFLPRLMRGLAFGATPEGALLTSGGAGRARNRTSGSPTSQPCSRQYPNAEPSAVNRMLNVLADFAPHT
ncbi:hypothetical protein [Nocardia rhamnosiphila]